MRDLRESIRRLLYGNPITTAIFPAGIVLVFLHPIVYMVNNALYISFLDGLSSVLYLFYLLGIVMCLANNLDWAIVAAIYIKAFGALINICNGFSINKMMLFLIYVLLGTIFLLILLAARRGNDMLEFSFNTPKTSRENPCRITPEVAREQHCPFCGNLAEEDARFCSVCGRKYPNEFFKQGQEGTYAAGWTGIILNLCGSPLVLTFNIFLSVDILLKIITNFSFSNILGQVFMLLICISGWIIYAGSRSGNLTSTGFSIINVIMIIELVFSLVFSVILAIIGIVIASTGYSDAVAVGAGFIIAGIIIALLVFFYWNGLRKTSASAKKILLGQSVRWTASVYCIVIMCCRVLGNIFGFIAKIALSASYSSIINSFTNMLSNYTGGGELMDDFINQIGDNLLGESAVLGNISSLISIAVSVCAIIILCKIYSANTEVND